MSLGSFNLIDTARFLENQEEAIGIQACDSCQICDDGNCWDCIDNE